MSCKIRRLSEAEVKNLTEIFSTEKSDDSIYLWQDRQSNFLKIYEPIICDEPQYWGAFIGKELVGCSGLIPLKIDPAYGIDQVWLDTDLFVKPEFRNQKIGHHLVAGRFLDGHKETHKVNQLFFGIEQTLGQLELCTKLGLRQKIQFLFPMTTKLRQEFLTQKENLTGINLLSEQIPVQSCLLSELTEIQIEQWLQSLSKSTFLNFAVNALTISRLVELDPEARAIFTEKNQRLIQGCILLSQSQGRCFRLTTKNSMILERLRRRSDCQLRAGDELKIGVLGLCFGLDPIKTLASRIHFEAELRNFHCLSYRPIITDESAIFSKDVLDFERRIFLVFRDSFPQAKKLLHDLENNKLQIKLDSLLL